jgi:hypothetical protein
MTTTGDYGQYRCDDGHSRTFVPDSMDPRVIVAMVLAKRGGWAEIRPGTWTEAGAIVRELKAKGQLVDRRVRKSP